MKEKLSFIIDCIMTFIFGVIVVLTITMTLLRYLFGTSLIGGSELLRYLFIYSTCLGAGVLLGRDEHVGIKVVINLMPDLVKKLINVFNNLIIIILHGYLIYLSISWISKLGMNLSYFFRIPMKYIQIGLPISFILVIFYALNNIYQITFIKDNKWKI
jgi:TRAP-type transport system small permease protein